MTLPQLQFAFYNVGIQSEMLRPEARRHTHHMSKLCRDLRQLLASLPNLSLLHLCEFGGHGHEIPASVQTRLTTEFSGWTWCFQNNYVLAYRSEEVTFVQEPYLVTLPPTVRSAGIGQSAHTCQTYQCILRGVAMNPVTVIHLHSRSSKEHVLKEGARKRIVQWLLNHFGSSWLLGGDFNTEIWQMEQFAAPTRLLFVADPSQRMFRRDYVCHTTDMSVELLPCKVGHHYGGVSDAHNVVACSLLALFAGSVTARAVPAPPLPQPNTSVSRASLLSIPLTIPETVPPPPPRAQTPPPSSDSNSSVHESPRPSPKLQVCTPAPTPLPDSTPSPPVQSLPVDSEFNPQRGITESEGAAWPPPSSDSVSARIVPDNVSIESSDSVSARVVPDHVALGEDSVSARVVRRHLPTAAAPFDDEASWHSASSGVRSCSTAPWTFVDVPPASVVSAASGFPPSAELLAAIHTDVSAQPSPIAPAQLPLQQMDNKDAALPLDPLAAQVLTLEADDFSTATTLLQMLPPPPEYPYQELAKAYSFDGHVYSYQEVIGHYGPQQGHAEWLFSCRVTHDVLSAIQTLGYVHARLSEVEALHPMATTLMTALRKILLPNDRAGVPSGIHLPKILVQPLWVRRKAFEADGASGESLTARMDDARFQAVWKDWLESWCRGGLTWKQWQQNSRTRRGYFFAMLNRECGNRMWCQAIVKHGAHSLADLLLALMAVKHETPQRPARTPALQAAKKHWLHCRTAFHVGRSYYFAGYSHPLADAYASGTAELNLEDARSAYRDLVPEGMRVELWPALDSLLAA